eukprot:Pgem_evm1s17434
MDARLKSSILGYKQRTYVENKKASIVKVIGLLKLNLESLSYESHDYMDCLQYNQNTLNIIQNLTKKDDI